MSAGTMVLPLVLLLPLLAFGYNVDEKHPIIYADPKLQGNEPVADSARSYFGYSVLLYEGHIPTHTWLFVGAPRSNYTTPDASLPIEPGVAYRCSHLQPCKELTPKKIGNDKASTEFRYSNITDSRIAKIIRGGTILKSHGWFGAAMAVRKKHDTLTVCAPRTILFVNGIYDMHGMCYTGSILGYDFENGRLTIENKNSWGYHFEDNTDWSSPSRGFSVQYSPIQENLKNPNRITGLPCHRNGGSVEITNMNLTLKQLKNEDDTTNFGYATAAGRFFEKNWALYASGGPGWRYKGQVAIIDTEDGSINTTLESEEIGEYFGASLAAGDLNGDGLDDLVVGAPHWKTDNGRVYIYLGSSTMRFEDGVILEGAKAGGHFGYALACGDLDRDGYADLIVGAPWEESGAIYIYNGQKELRRDSLSAFDPTQRIEASKISHLKYRLQGFGFSLSEPADIDSNGYPEVAVGAYKSGNAVILRGRPVISTEVSLETYPKLLENSDSFNISVCLEYHGTNAPPRSDFSIEATIDEGKVHRQVDQEKITFKNLTVSNNGRSCSSHETVTFKPGNRNFLDPAVNISIKYEIVNNNTSFHEVLIDGTSSKPAQDEFCAYCPVESKETVSELHSWSLPYNIVCNSNISMTARFVGVPDGNIWTIGSGDVTVEASLENHGEPAYLPVVTFSIPEGISLRSLPKNNTCKKEYRNSTLTVICDVANSLTNEAMKNVSLELDMINVRGSDRELTFNLSASACNILHGGPKISLPLQLRSEHWLNISGKANEGIYPYQTGDNITFEHTYEILKYGVSPMAKASLTVEVPIAIESTSKTFMLLNKPQLFLAGINADDACSSIESNKAGENARTKRSANTTNQKVETETKIIGTSQNQTTERDTDQKDGIDSATRRTIYLNCSTQGVVCKEITCTLHSLETARDLGKLHLTMVLDTSMFTEESDEEAINIRLSTTARIQGQILNGTRDVAEVSTVFYGTPLKSVPLLWIIGSVLLGLLLLGLLITTLCRLGFFKRRKYEPMTDENDATATPKEEGVESMEMSN